MNESHTPQGVVASSQSNGKDSACRCPCCWLSGRGESTERPMCDPLYCNLEHVLRWKFLCAWYRICTQWRGLHADAVVQHGVLHRVSNWRLHCQQYAWPMRSTLTPCKFTWSATVVCKLMLSEAHAILYLCTLEGSWLSDCRPSCVTWPPETLPTCDESANPSLTSPHKMSLT